MNLEKFLTEYDKKDIYPMHMPGHKRSGIMDMANPYTIDVTEAGELDDLHNPQGILAETMDRCAGVFGSSSSFFLVNGSTCGLLAGIFAATKNGDKILVARNCHKSVYNGIYLRGLEPVYVYPEIDREFGISGSIKPEDIKRELKQNRDIKLVVITSPTYEGVVSDVKSIAKICHKYKVPLLVDGAHGAHFGFHPGLPERSIVLGADMVVESVHKTLPSLTQTAVMHLSSSLIEEAELRQYLAMFQTTSPSYVLMSSIDKCVGFVSSPEGQDAFEKYMNMLSDFSESMKALKLLKVLCKGNDSLENHPSFFRFDPGKIVISLGDSEITGTKLEETWREKFRIQAEMAYGNYLVAMTSICDTEKGFERLKYALFSVDSELEDEAIKRKKSDDISVDSPYFVIKGGLDNDKKKHQGYDTAFEIDGISPPKGGEAAMTSSEALNSPGLTINAEDCGGEISQEYIYAYPPGVPLVVPGEKISEEMLEYIDML
ncbi:MAG: aminotransferase class I/II-fold pyridoxal phosphate-dependent enzyme, partial [Bacillota bacterium]|nr:aminotransferase class I/II-fold pyridoxal phosphate-dependent enzyme [Bacillota bacterium]